MIDKRGPAACSHHRASRRHAPGTSAASLQPSPPTRRRPRNALEPRPPPASASDLHAHRGSICCNQCRARAPKRHEVLSTLKHGISWEFCRRALAHRSTRSRQTELRFNAEEAARPPNPERTTTCSPHTFLQEGMSTSQSRDMPTRARSPHASEASTLCTTTTMDCVMM